MEESYSGGRKAVATSDIGSITVELGTVSGGTFTRAEYLAEGANLEGLNNAFTIPGVTLTSYETAGDWAELSPTTVYLLPSGKALKGGETYDIRVTATASYGYYFAGWWRPYYDTTTMGLQGDYRGSPGTATGVSAYSPHQGAAGGQTYYNRSNSSGSLILAEIGLDLQSEYMEKGVCPGQATLATETPIYDGGGNFIHEVAHVVALFAPLLDDTSVKTENNSDNYKLVTPLGAGGKPDETVIKEYIFNGGYQGPKVATAAINVSTHSATIEFQGQERDAYESGISYLLGNNGDDVHQEGEYFVEEDFAYDGSAAAHGRQINVRSTVYTYKYTVYYRGASDAGNINSRFVVVSGEVKYRILPNAYGSTLESGKYNFSVSSFEDSVPTTIQYGTLLPAASFFTTNYPRKPGGSYTLIARNYTPKPTDVSILHPGSNPPIPPVYLYYDTTDPYSVTTDIDTFKPDVPGSFVWYMRTGSGGNTVEEEFDPATNFLIPVAEENKYRLFLKFVPSGEYAANYVVAESREFLIKVNVAEQNITIAGESQEHGINLKPWYAPSITEGDVAAATTNTNGEKIVTATGAYIENYIGAITYGEAVMSTSGNAKTAFETEFETRILDGASRLYIAFLEGYAEDESDTFANYNSSENKNDVRYYLVNTTLGSFTWGFTNEQKGSDPTELISADSLAIRTVEVTWTPHSGYYGLRYGECKFILRYQVKKLEVLFNEVEGSVGTANAIFYGQFLSGAVPQAKSVSLQNGTDNLVDRISALGNIVNDKIIAATRGEEDGPAQFNYTLYKAIIDYHNSSNPSDYTYTMDNSDIVWSTLVTYESLDLSAVTNKWIGKGNPANTAFAEVFFADQAAPGENDIFFDRASGILYRYLWNQGQEQFTWSLVVSGVGSILGDNAKYVLYYDGKYYVEDGKTFVEDGSYDPEAGATKAKYKFLTRITDTKVERYDTAPLSPTYRPTAENADKYFAFFVSAAYAFGPNSVVVNYGGAVTTGGILQVIGGVKYFLVSVLVNPASLTFEF
ncbi:MAG: hypothetical protein LBN25_03645, partial [Christensenellaceae bacterium]|nr:hypothetical protein [Christensenellaceae bacterium]